MKGGKTKRPSRVSARPIYSVLKRLAEEKPKQKATASTSNAVAKREAAATAAAADIPQETGSGRPGDPIRLALRASPNERGCLHCPTPSCECAEVTSMLAEIYGRLASKRVVEVYGQRHLCAKSLLPVFVSRLIRIMRITREDTFYDLGCGNGSVLLQVAATTGARCVGVEISAHNAQVAREASEALAARERAAGRAAPRVDIIAGDVGEFLSDAMSELQQQGGRTAVLTSNLLFPRAVTHFMSEKFRQLPSGSRIACFDDLYPHSRSVAALRDPELFQLFDMCDYLWQRESVEWCGMEGPFYVHWRR